MLHKNLLTETGYYWAKWLECDSETKDHDIFEARQFFEPVEVTLNVFDEALPPKEKF